MALKKETLTKAQKAELENLRSFIVRRGLSPVMTGADWRSAINAVMAITDYTGMYRYRGVRDLSDPPATAWLGPLPAGLPLFNFIEWLELSPKQAGTPDFSASIKQALTAVKIAYSETATGIRILGYRRNKA